VLLAWWLIGGILLTFLTLKYLRHDAGRRGTRRVLDDATPHPQSTVTSARDNPSVAITVATPIDAAAVAPAHSAEAMPPVPRIVYTFHDVTYTVRVPRPKGAANTDGRRGGLVDKVLLRGVTGYFEPVSEGVFKFMPFYR
jgi:hypothetical protein